MAGYRYHVVPFQGEIKPGEDVKAVSDQLTSMINYFAGKGWEFYKLGSVSIRVNQGCLGALLGQTASMIAYDQVIFRRAV